MILLNVREKAVNIILLLEKLEDEKKIKKRPRKPRKGKGIPKKEDFNSAAKPTTMSLSTLHDSSVSSSEDEGYEDTREQDSVAGSDVLEKPKEPKSVLTGQL